jgi:hypothetical protein
MKLQSLRGARPVVRALAVLAALAGLATLAQARAVHIDLHAAASAQTAQVVLSDIATLSNADEATLARLGALDVGRVSADGKATLVDRAALARWIQARTGVLSTDIVWSGAPRCSVRMADGPAAASLATEPARAVAATPVATTAHPAVARGNLASLRSVSGAIALESRVEVLDDGVVGQDVHVRLPGANEAVVARVTAPGRVEVAQ